MSFKNKIIVTVAASVVILSGCTDSNPLEKYKHKIIAQDLVASAASAEIKLGLVKYPYQAGHYYSNCMEGKLSSKTCQAIYKIMWSNLKNQYRGLTVTNLQDKRLWSYVKDYYRVDILVDHCPDIQSIHLNKNGYYVALGGWKSKTNGHQYVLSDNWKPTLSGWRYMDIVGFIQADAETNVDTNKIELQFCEYRVVLKNNAGGPVIPMYLVPIKKRFIHSKALGWIQIGVFSYICQQHDNPRINKPEYCAFSS